MARVSKSVAEVIAGEAGGRTRAARYNDMRTIASVIANRAAQLGVTPEQVVQRQSEFNAFGKRMPGGTAALVGLAEDALREVATTGPVTNATFYATPAATKNLPKGLQSETATASHRYFSDPQNRAIYTSVGLRTPAVEGRAKLGRPLDSYDAAALPTPTPRDVTLASTMPARPVTPTLTSTLSPRQEASLADRLGGLFGVTPAAAAERVPGLGYAPSTPTPRAAGPGLLSGYALDAMSTPTATPTGNERARSAMVSAPAPVSTPFPSMPSGRTGRLSGLPSGPIAATPMSPATAANVSARIDTGFGAPQPTMPSTGGLLTPTALNSMSSRMPVSGNERAAGLYTQRQLLDADVADRRRQMASAYAQPPVTAPAVQKPAVFQGPPMPAGLLATTPKPISFNAPAIDAAQAEKTSRLVRTAPAPAPALAPLPDPVTIAASPRVASVSAAPLPAALDRPRAATSTGLGLPDVPAQPAQPGLLSQGGLLDRNRGMIAGGLLGGVALGPLGLIGGGLLGNAIQGARMGTPSVPARRALDAGWDGFSPQTEAQVDAAAGVEHRAVGEAVAPGAYPGMPSVPAAPTPRSIGLLGNGTFTNRRNGMLAGGLLGSTLAGPAGGLVGALIGRSIGNSSYGSPSYAAQAALNSGWDGVSGMTSAQTNAANRAPAGGGSAAWGGGGGGGLFGGGGLLGSIGSAIGGLFGGGTSTGGNFGGFSTSSATGPGGARSSNSSSPNYGGSNNNTSPSKSSGSKSSSSSSGKKK